MDVCATHYYIQRYMYLLYYYLFSQKCYILIVNIFLAKLKIPPIMKKRKLTKAHGEKHKKQQHKIVSDMRQSVFDMLVDNSMNSSDAISFVHSLEKELGHTPQGLLDFRQAIEKQFNQLS